MAFFSAALDDALRERGWTQKELADRTGIGAPQISRYMHGAHPPAESVTRVLGVISDERWQARIAAAYALDCLPSEYRSLVEIHPRSGRLAEDAGGERPRLVPGIDTELDLMLRAYADLAMRHTEVRDMLGSFLRAVGAKIDPASPPRG